MNKSSKDRFIKNEQILRDKNTAAGRSIKKYFHNDSIAENAPIAFICECSRLDCDEHVSISIQAYEKLHRRKDYFVIVPGHESPSVEKLIADQESFYVVEKFALSRS